MNPRPDSPRRRDERGSALLAFIVVLFALALAGLLVQLQVNAKDLEYSGLVREDAEGHFLVVAGRSDALREIRADQDGEAANKDHGDRARGLGALGIDTPLVYRDSDGRALGEYKTYVVNKALDPVNDPPVYALRILGAVPSFAAVENDLPGSRRYAAEARIGTRPNFLLAPNTGAISIAGPVDTFQFRDWDNPGFTIDGGNFPALILTNEDTHDTVIEYVDGRWTNSFGSFPNNPLIDRITGNPLLTKNEGQPDEFEAPIVLQEEIALSADVLNDYRDALRGFAEQKVYATPSNGSATIDFNAARADPNVDIVHELPAVKDGAGNNRPRITTDLDFSGNPDRVVLLDSSRFQGGGSFVTDNFGRTVTGEGTLVILHPIGSFSDNANGKQFNLSWTGDVFVLGYPKDTTQGVGNNNKTNNLLYISRADWNVQGNLVVLSSGTTEASLEMRGTGADPANLQVTGAMLMFSEATGREAEIDIESNANMRVDGLVGVFGKRAELENQDGGTGTAFIINGTLAVGLPENVNSSMELEVEGQAEFTFDVDLVENAVDGLAALQQQLNFQNEVPQGIDYDAFTFIEDANQFDAWKAELDAFLASGTFPPGGDRFGVDTDLVNQNK